MIPLAALAAEASSSSRHGFPRRATRARPRADTLFVVTVHPEGDATLRTEAGLPGSCKSKMTAYLRFPTTPAIACSTRSATSPRTRERRCVFWDFDAGKLLHLAGRATLHLDEGGPGLEPGNTGRFWRFRTERWSEQHVPVPFRMQLVERSRFNPISPG